MLVTLKKYVSTVFTTIATVYVQEKTDGLNEQEMDGMGNAEIKYGDSVCFLQHVVTGLWVTYQVDWLYWLVQVLVVAICFVSRI